MTEPDPKFQMIAFNRDLAVNAVQQKLLDLFAQLDPWDADEDLRADAEAIVSAVEDSGAYRD